MSTNTISTTTLTTTTLTTTNPTPTPTTNILMSTLPTYLTSTILSLSSWLPICSTILYLGCTQNTTRSSNLEVLLI